MKIIPNKKRNFSNNKTPTNRFLAEILKINFKILKCVLLAVSEKMYFYFSITNKILNHFLFVIILYEGNAASGPKYSSSIYFL